MLSITSDISSSIESHYDDSVKSKNKVAKKSKKRKLKAVEEEPKRFPRPVKRFPKPEDWTPPSYRIIVKKELDEETKARWMSTPPGWLTALTEDADGDPTELYDYQDEHLLDQSIFKGVDKARQTGFSYGKAGEALAKSHLKLVQTTIFISKDKEEANEKIYFAKYLYHSMPSEYQRKCVVDNKQSMEFEYKGRRTRILSFAQRQPRGKGNNTDILLDEFAHMMWAEEIYTAAVPVITRGSGTITVGSTPLGKGTLHYEIMNNKEGFPYYSRIQIPWWYCPVLCTNVKEARKLAPFMETQERVHVFGTKKLKMIFKSMIEMEDFQQEYELYTADSSYSYFPLDLIRSCVFEDEKSLVLEGNIDPDEIPVGFAPVKGEHGLVMPDTIMTHYKDEHINWYCDTKTFHDENNILEGVEEMVDRLLLAMQIEGFGRNLLLGMDIGRKRDSSEISILEEYEIDLYNLHIERLSIELIQIPYRIQKEVVKLLIKKLPIVKATIDGTEGSHGADIAETLAFEFPQVIESMNFSPESKARMAKNFRFRLEDRTIALLNDSKSIKQIHSIKKTITEAANVKFGAEKSKKHHGDKFWAKALASIGGNEYDRNNIIHSGKIIGVGSSRSFASNLHNGDGIIRIADKSTALPMQLVKARIHKGDLLGGHGAYQQVFSDFKQHKF
jgi:phage FluMu gp28-like protein